jgi:hypothetical protein
MATSMPGQGASFRTTDPGVASALTDRAHDARQLPLSRERRRLGGASSSTWSRSRDAFGLENNGRVESISMSLPPLVRWDYDVMPTPNAREAELVSHVRPITWLVRS